ncbi:MULTISPECIES: YciI-like protein [Rhizobium]|uniref:YciI-like protein n=1 Tax=Rhizobium rhododendri TaxID=2506430 RepID=A0ABY8IFG8_9HYPH|nr:MULTISPECIES: YciI-like protein [Rhizobium]MBZ5760835.1 YciI family protein [Rhizobium sp. VS19-DR96]MBZ5765381.1 YciI family protein [Rhizobium sp. VS19-DR129.2]MBZ5774656.1 YciI family protein [Rhizobium sp. VS19-DRK62.2]MBZ5784670.1 YciI family protein [Rhizobium sp. VS19-DR121]MBZ5801282.1 YciI family protein [Rhizobium sp. VS19-DR181]
MLFAFLCKDKPDHLHVRMDTRPAHVEHLNKLNDEGTLKMAGPFLGSDEKPCGSLVIVEAASLADAQALADADPYAKAGLFESVEVKPFNWVFNKPEA